MGAKYSQAQAQIGVATLTDLVFSRTPLIKTEALQVNLHAL